MQFTTAKVLLGLGCVSSALAAPAVGSSTERFTLSAAELFPHAKTSLEHFNIDVDLIDYDKETLEWLKSLKPSALETDEEKATMFTEAMNLQPFDENSLDMTSDREALLAAVNGDTHAVSKRANQNLFKLASGHAVVWHTCKAFYSCISGTSCSLKITPNSSPRDKCQKIGKVNCCMSWSDIYVKAGFFETTFQQCNDLVNSEHKDNTSCEGYGSTGNGGDVCFSNRPNGCT